MKVSLVMFKEDGQQKTFDLDARTIVGRKDDCDLRIPLEQVSRRHAMLMVTDKTVTIRDLGSSNGTYVNNERVTEQDLAPGDRVVIGPVVFTVQVNGQPADIKPAHTRLETKASLTKTGAAGATADQDSGDFVLDEDDPISELEALAASDETAAIDLGESDLNMGTNS